jgi:hypothetical protein
METGWVVVNQIAEMSYNFVRGPDEAGQRVAKQAKFPQVVGRQRRVYAATITLLQTF